MQQTCFRCRLVGGMETLDKMEHVEVDKNDRPKVGSLGCIY